LAAHDLEFLDGLPEMSNPGCHPGRAGGPLFFVSDSFYVWNGSGYVKTDNSGTFTPTYVPEYGALSMLILSALTLAGGFFFKAKQSGLFLAA
jgi:hypothetical protein